MHITAVLACTSVGARHKETVIGSVAFIHRPASCYGYWLSRPIVHNLFTPLRTSFRPHRNSTSMAFYLVCITLPSILLLTFLRLSDGFAGTMHMRELWPLREGSG